MTGKVADGDISLFEFFINIVPLISYSRRGMSCYSLHFTTYLSPPPSGIRRYLFVYDCELLCGAMRARSPQQKITKLKPQLNLMSKGRAL